MRGVDIGREDAADKPVFGAVGDGDGIGDNADEDDDNQLLSISPGCNVLSLVMRNENIMRFIKYVSHNAPGSRWDIAVDYEIESNEEDDDSDNDDSIIIASQSQLHHYCVLIANNLKQKIELGLTRSAMCSKVLSSSLSLSLSSSSLLLSPLS